MMYAIQGIEGRINLTMISSERFCINTRERANPQELHVTRPLRPQYFIDSFAHFLSHGLSYPGQPIFNLKDQVMNWFDINHCSSFRSFVSFLLRPIMHRHFEVKLTFL